MITRSGTNDVHGSAFPHRPQQRLRRGAPAAGHLHQGAAPGAQRVRRVAGRARVSSPRSTTARTGPSSSPPGRRCGNRQASTTTSAVWTDAMRQGDFSGLIDGQNRRITLYDPWSVGAGPNYTKTPYINNQLPMSRLSPIAKYMFGVTPSAHQQPQPAGGQQLHRRLQPTSTSTSGPSPSAATTASAITTWSSAATRAALRTR